jgi:hypothetical protein
MMSDTQTMMTIAQKEKAGDPMPTQMRVDVPAPPPVTTDAPLTEAEERDLAERYLNSVAINLGEAVAAFGNIRQRRGRPGPDYANVRLALHRAFAASLGQPYVPPVGTEKGR